MKLTRSNVAYDLNISPHRMIMEYSNNHKIEFVFSSDLYKRKFEEKLIDNRIKINESLSNRFGFSIENDVLSDLKLYTTIEKRGFLIYQNELGIECLNDIILNGQMLTTN